MNVEHGKGRTTEYWSELAGRLRLELAGADERSARTLNLGLFRILAEHLDRDREAAEMLDALSGDPEAAAAFSLPWEELRFAAGRDSRSRARALERLSREAREPGLRAAAHLLLSALRAVHLSDPEGAEASLAAALELDPESRPGTWMRLLGELASSGDAAAAPVLDRLRGMSSDAVLGSALTLELASIRKRQGADADELAALHDEVLGLDVADWRLLNDVARECAGFGRYDLSIRAWERLARAALESPSAEDGERPAGHSFDGIRRGEGAAAAAWWMSGLLRERRCLDIPGALAAAENARAHLPDSDFLGTEVARLRRLAGAGAEAVSAEITHPALLPVEICLLAMAGGIARLVREIGDALPPAERTPLLEALVAGAGTTEDGDDEGGIDAGPADDPEGAEDPGARPWWREPEDGEHRCGWDPAIDALQRALDGSAAEGLLELAEVLRTDEIRAPLLTAAALAAEEQGRHEQTLELALAADGIAPDDARATELLLRALRRARRYDDLEQRLDELAARSPDPDRSGAALLERALLLEYALGKPDEAGAAMYDLAATRPDDAAINFSAARLSFRLGDWERALEYVDRLAEIASEDRPRLELLAGELLLFALGRDVEAAERFARAEGASAEPLATAARLYGLYAAHGRGDRDEAERLLRALSARGDGELWLAELAEVVRQNLGAAAAADLVEEWEPPVVARLLWSVMAGAGDGRDPGKALVELGRGAPGGSLPGACGAAAMLLGAGGGLDLAAVGRDSPEALWHLAERSWMIAEPSLRAELAEKRAAAIESGDPSVRSDWLLARAEVLEDAGRHAEALEVTREGVSRLPDHPGLLEAQARLASAAGEYAEAADTHGRLARFYVTQEGKATQLAAAAGILIDRLGDAQGAEKILREALRRVPTHPESNELLERLLLERDDDDGLVEQLESRIEAEYDTGVLVELYQEQADRLLAMEDVDGALEAIDNLLLLAGENAPAHRMKVDLLMSVGRWEEAVGGLGDLAAAEQDPVERRRAVWRAAETRAAELDDVGGALSILKELLDSGDEHPQTLRLMADLAGRGGCWEEAAQALEALAARLGDSVKRAGTLRERARILLEHLFDDEGAESLLKEALGIDPTDIEALGIALQFEEEDDARAMLDRAEADLQVALDGDPLDLETISRLRGVSEMLGRDDAVRACEEVSAILRGEAAEGRAEAEPPRAIADPDALRGLLLHPDERGSAASTVARLAAPLAGEVFAAAEGFPAVPREAFVGEPGSDPPADWARGWAAAIGAGVEVARYGEDPRGSVTLPGITPTVVVNRDLAWPADGGSRFFLARHVWRAVSGLGAFHEGDAATPLRWILALAAACLGDKAPLPLPTDRDLVDRARKAMPRKLRKALTEPCREMLGMTPARLRAWPAAVSSSADRFGLLATGDLAGAVTWVVEESAGPNGLRQLAERPANTLARVPRGRQIIRFALSPDYPAALAAAGVADPGGAR